MRSILWSGIEVCNDGGETIRKSCNITPLLDSFPPEKKPFSTLLLRSETRSILELKIRKSRFDIDGMLQIEIGRAHV